jgi:uncharacterized sporulation protein YeaH/YhbH (DUF444 family)
MPYTIIDRRLNPSGKNLNNRQRFIKRVKEHLKTSVKEGLTGRSITTEDDQSVSVPSDSIKEPWFHYDSSTGNREFVLPGNKEYMQGDLIERPQQNQGKAGNASDDGEGEDDFSFSISKDEFNDILFEDLELPELKKKSVAQTIAFMKVRAGFSSAGTPSSLDIRRSMKRSIGRRYSLKAPKNKKIQLLLDEIAELDLLPMLTAEQQERRVKLEEDIVLLKKRIDAVPFLDPVDLQYRNFEKKPMPKHKAVMFCVMDVSASMGAHEKELAKRFYLLLYLFLQYKYDLVDIVFIRHHTEAHECTEEEFFYSKETGGTVVSSGLMEMLRVQRERYAPDDWNIYVAQTSDGDNFSTDNGHVTELLHEKIIPLCQQYAYIEVRNTSNPRESDMWEMMHAISKMHKELKICQVNDIPDVYRIFRMIFSKENLV